MKDAAKLALENIAGVITNPEIQALTPMLLDCLMDPANETKATDVLTKLLHTSFVHAVDAASLALVSGESARSHFLLFVAVS